MRLEASTNKISKQSYIWGRERKKVAAGYQTSWIMAQICDEDAIWQHLTRFWTFWLERDTTRGTERIYMLQAENKRFCEKLRAARRRHLRMYNRKKKMLKSFKGKKTWPTSESENDESATSYHRDSKIKNCAENSKTLQKPECLWFYSSVVRRRTELLGEVFDSCNWANFSSFGDLWQRVWWY